MTSLTASIVVEAGGSADVERTADSVRFADEILVMEADARDPERSRAGCRAETIAKARHPLVLCLASGEQVSAALRAELSALMALPSGGDGPAAYRVPRRGAYLGRAVRCPWWQGEGDLRLLDRRKANGAVVGGRIVLGEEVIVGELRGEILSSGTLSLTSLLRDLARPTAAAAGPAPPLRDLATAPMLELWRSFLRRGGLEGGGPGFFLATMDSLEALVRLARRWDAANRAMGARGRS